LIGLKVHLTLKKSILDLKVRFYWSKKFTLCGQKKKKKKNQNATFGKAFAKKTFFFFFYLKAIFLNKKKWCKKV
jgi:hypothetical protein